MPSDPADLAHRMVALRPRLRRQAAYLIGQRTHLGTPDDFVQDTIVTALLHCDRFIENNLPGWLLSILHGHIRNAQRRTHIRTSVPLSVPGTGEEDAAETIEFPVAATQELRLALGDAMGALKRLSAADQEIIWLARIDELSHEQIAARLHVPLGTLHARLSRATARLRKIYEAGPGMAMEAEVRGNADPGTTANMASVAVCSSTAPRRAA